MDINQQIAILIGLGAAQVVAMALPYWMGRQAGWQQAEAARTEFEQMQAEHAQACVQRDRFERDLLAMRMELRRVESLRSQEFRRHAEAEAALHLERAEHAAQLAEQSGLLREASRTIRLACTGWEAMGAVTKARQSRPLAGDLERLADALSCDFIPSKEALHA